MKNHPTDWFRHVAYGVTATVLGRDSYDRFGLGQPAEKPLHGRTRDPL